MDFFLIRANVGSTEGFLLQVWLFSARHAREMSLQLVSSLMPW